MIKTRAYSYLRFSTPEQMNGHSFERQTQAASQYAKENNLDLDSQLTFHDSDPSMSQRSRYREQFGRIEIHFKSVDAYFRGIVVGKNQKDSWGYKVGSDGQEQVQHTRIMDAQWPVGFNWLLAGGDPDNPGQDYRQLLHHTKGQQASHFFH